MRPTSSIFRFVVFAFGCLAFAACSRAGSSRASDARLVIAQIGDPKSLDTLLVGGYVVNQLDGLLYSMLTTYDRDGNPIPQVALAVPTRENGGISADGLRITYRLRRDVRWQDGVPLTARDVVFTYDAIVNPRNSVGTRLGFDRIASVRAPDAYTVTVTLKRPYAPIVADFFGNDGAAYGILPSHLLRRYASLDTVAYNAAPVASGPYRLAEWLRGDSETWTAYDGYFLGKPHVRTIVVKFVPDVETIANQLRTGEADLAFEVPPRQAKELEHLPGHRILRTRDGSVLVLSFDTQDPVVSDLAVRRALALGIDRHALVRDRFANAYDAESGMQPFFSWAYDAAVDRIAYDPGEARAILTRDGWRPGPGGIRFKDGKPLELTFVVRNTFEPSGVEIAADAARLGIRMRIKTVTPEREFAPSGPLYSGRFQVELSRFGSSIDPEPSWLLACDERPPAGYDFTRYCNPAVDALLARAAATYDRAARERDLVDVQRHVMHDLPVIALAQGAELDVVPSDMQGYDPTFYVANYANAYRWNVVR